MGGGLSPVLLRPGLLAGLSLLLAGDGELASAAGGACEGLGARVASCAPLDESGAVADEAELDAAVAGLTREAGGVDLLAVDGAGLFAGGLAPSGDGHTALRACMDGAWNATRAVVNQAFLASLDDNDPGVAGRAGGDAARGAPAGGRIVYLTPRVGAGEHAGAARAGLENLARTLSTEWARHGVTTVAVAPGADTPAEEVATLVAYLASPAGAYFSGCLLDLRGVAEA